jgi:hypothetical protein
VAGNGNSGRNPVFPLSEKELAEKFEQYKDDLAAGKFARPSWSHFNSYIGCLETETKEFMQTYYKDAKSAYYRRARMLMGVDQYMQGQLCSSKEWSGQQTGVAKMLIEHDNGSGIVCRGKEQQDGPKEMICLFGNGDLRAELAAK